MSFRLYHVQNLRVWVLTDISTMVRELCSSCIDCILVKSLLRLCKLPCSSCCRCTLRCAVLCQVVSCYATLCCVTWNPSRKSIHQPFRRHKSCCQDRNTCAAVNKVCLPLSTSTTKCVCHHNTPYLSPQKALSSTMTYPEWWTAKSVQIPMINKPQTYKHMDRCPQPCVGNLSSLLSLHKRTMSLAYAKSLSPGQCK